MVYDETNYCLATGKRFNSGIAYNEGQKGKERVLKKRKQAMVLLFGCL